MWTSPHTCKSLKTWRGGVCVVQSDKRLGGREQIGGWGGELASLGEGAAAMILQRRAESFDLKKRLERCLFEGGEMRVYLV